MQGDGSGDTEGERSLSTRLPGAAASGPRSAAAETIADLGWLMLALGGGVFVLFAVLLAVGLLRRHQPEHEAEAENSGLERRWIIGGGVVMPLIVLVVVLVATVGAMRSLRNDAPPDALAIAVVGHQWWWEVRYPTEEITTANELRVPVGRPVALRLTSADVIHSFWVPALAGKMDMLPDGTNTLVLEADEPGEYLSQCAEFCGLQHTKMALTVVAEPPEDFASWVASQKNRAIEPAGATAQRGLQAFLDAGCGSCHTVRGTSARGVNGPDLTHVASRPTLGAGTVANTPAHLAEWVRDPHRLKAGVKMPPSMLTPEQLEAVVAYLESLR